MSELRSVLNPKKSIKFYLNSAWYFETWFEKLVIILLGVFGMWKIIELLWNLF